MEYTLKFNEKELQIISDALVQAPYFISAPVIDSINRQIVSLQELKNTQE